MRLTKFLFVPAAVALAVSLSACDNERNPSPFQFNLNNQQGDVVALVNTGSGQRLVMFNRDNPSRILNTAAINLPAGQRLIGIDYRPLDEKLYALTTSAVYTVDPRTGALSEPVALSSGMGLADGVPPPVVPLIGNSFGFDFNPAVDRLRVVSDANTSLVVNVDTGVVNASPNINDMGSAITASAYTNSFLAPVNTVLWVLDTMGDRLLIQNAGNSVLSNPIALGVNADAANGFDIDAVNNVGYASLTVAGSTQLYKINLAATVAPAATPVGAIGNGQMEIEGLALAPVFTVAHGLTTDNRLVSFEPTRADKVTTRNITGLMMGETVLGIDVRPKDGKLYGLTSQARLITINPLNGAATIGRSLNVALPVSVTAGDPPTTRPVRYSVDFNPAADRLRVINTEGLNLRIDVDAGITNIDGMINAMTGQVPVVAAAAYTNSFSRDENPGVGTMLFNIDRANSQLTLQDPPNAGTQVARGPIAGGLLPADLVTLDIAGGANGLPLYSRSTAGGANTLSTINTADGALTTYPAGNLVVDGNAVVAPVGGGAPLSDIAIELRR